MISLGKKCSPISWGIYIYGNTTIHKWGIQFSTKTPFKWVFTFHYMKWKGSWWICLHSWRSKTKKHTWGAPPLGKSDIGEYCSEMTSNWFKSDRFGLNIDLNAANMGPYGHLWPQKICDLQVKASIGSPCASWIPWGWSHPRNTVVFRSSSAQLGFIPIWRACNIQNSNCGYGFNSKAGRIV